MDPDSVPEVTPEVLQAHPGLAFAILVFTGVVFLAFTGALLTWATLGYLWWHRRPILPVKLWSPRPWGLIEIVLTGFTVVASQVLLTVLIAPMLGIDMEFIRSLAEKQEPLPLSLSALVSAGYLLTAFAMTTWIVLRYQASPAILGWGLSQFGKKLFIGLVAGLGFLPLLFAVNAIVSLSTQTPYEHPIMSAMESEGSLNAYLYAVFSAVVVAPIAEEFLFRTLLQGWLQSIPFVSPITALLGRIGGNTPRIPVGAGEVSSGEVSTSEPISDQHRNPYAATMLIENEGQFSEGRETPGPDLEPSENSTLQVMPPIWPAVLAGTLFGLAHWGYGLSFIPLIGLGIFLGLLYRATQSIWPCIVVHFMLNASSMAGLGLVVYIKNVAG